MEPNSFPDKVRNAMWHPVPILVSATDISRSVFSCPTGWFVRLRKVTQIHKVASTSGTIQIEALASGAVADAGVDQLTTALSLAGTINVTQEGVLISEPTLLSPGMSLAIVIGGTMTNLTGCNITLFLEVMQRNQQ